jgi:hypothetical protein
MLKWLFEIGKADIWFRYRSTFKKAFLSLVKRQGVRQTLDGRSTCLFSFVKSPY